MLLFLCILLHHIVWCFISVSCTTQNLNLTINVTSIITDIPIPFYGFTFETISSLKFNLSNSDLLALTTKLSPALLRIGGDTEDEIIYNISGECLPYENNNTYQQQLCYGKNVKYISCLTMSRWQEINEFAVKTNVTLLFGLNACYGRDSSNSSMNFSNIQSLFEITSNFNKNITSNLYAFEFGNELWTKVDASAYAKDYKYAYQLLQQTYKYESNKPYLIGFDCNPNTYNEQAFNTLFTINNYNKSLVTEMVHRFTYHHYTDCDFLGNSTNIYHNGSMFNLTCLKSVELTAINNSFLANKWDTIAWMGEGAEHSHGGTANVTNTFADSFYFVYQLCELLKNGVRGTARSTLMGGNYEIINHLTLSPNPDYWILYIFKQLIGNKMIESTINIMNLNNCNVCGYVFNGKQNNNALVVALINFDLSDPAKIVVDIIDNNTTYMYEEYHLKGIGYGGLQTNVVAVNNVIMEYDNGIFPVLEPKIGTNVIQMSASTITFVVITPQITNKSMK